MTTARMGPASSGGLDLEAAGPGQSLLHSKESRDSRPSSTQPLSPGGAGGGSAGELIGQEAAAGPGRLTFPIQS